MAPSTTTGQAFCVIYALIGIPLTLIVLAEVGEHLHRLLLNINKHMRLCSVHPKYGQMLRTFFIGIIGGFIFLVLPASLFARLESWSFGEAFYYSFITLSTVGFGDYIPGNNIQAGF